jgi:hypothetical protein
MRRGFRGWGGAFALLAVVSCSSTRTFDEVAAGSAGTGGAAAAGAGAQTGGSSAAGGASTVGGGAGDSAAGGPAAEAGAGGSSAECSDGATQPCGTDVGNCVAGEQTCDGGVWSECVGGVTPATHDSCEPDDDADCDGAKNEGCACTADQTMDCGNCGTQACQDGTWAGCAGEGACAEGDEETRSVSCGNCGMQSQRRTCSAQCGWGAWEDVGACAGQGECEIGTEKTATDVSCGYCGNQPRKQICTAECTWGAAENNGSCVHLSCGNYPGDERVDWVACGGAAAPGCAPTSNCCISAAAAVSCQVAACSGSTRSECDGPEDCAANQYCIVQYPGPVPVGKCSTDGSASRWCHVNSDCPANAKYCRTTMPSNSYGHCSSSP